MSIGVDEVSGRGTSAVAPSRNTPLEKVIFWIGVLLSLWHIYFNLRGTLPENITSSLHFGGFGLLCALIYPLRRGYDRGSAALLIDMVIGCAAVASAVYLIFAYDAFFERGVSFIWSDWVFSLIAIGVAIELTRRTTGWIIPILIIVALTYVTGWGNFVSGIFNFRGLTAETLLYRSYFGGDGMFGAIARISSTFVFMFILFGAFLLRSGAGDFILALARKLAGRVAGGPGFVAVLGSALTGTISGSAVANTVSTGVITIPLMKRTGFPAKFAAGVEASASTGGQLMPPIMGAGAFIMASYTQIPYLDIVAVSFLPALLFFASVAIYVRIEAMRSGVTVDSEESEDTGSVLQQGGAVFIVPIATLIGLLIYGFTPVYAAGIATLAIVVTSWFTANKMGLSEILDALALGARNMVSTAVLLIAIGLVVNVVATTGIGNTIALMITQWADGSLLITLLFVGMAALILGMGLPVTAAYIVLATLAAPALFDLIVHGALVDALMGGAATDTVAAIFMLAAPELSAVVGTTMTAEQATQLLASVPPDMVGLIRDDLLDASLLTVSLLSAHMIIFWLSQFSNVTPPVCLTAFAAAAIAETPPMATGFTALKISQGLYIVPLLFAFTAFLSPDFLVTAEIFAFALFGIYALAGAIEGHLESAVHPALRLILLVSAVALLWPLGAWFKVIAVLVVIAIVGAQQRRIRKQPQ